MSRTYKLITPDTQVEFTPAHDKSYKLNSSGYFEFTAPSEVLPTELVIVGSKSDLRRLDAIESNITKLFAQMLGKSSFSGSYNDLTGKPVLAKVATTGSYLDLADRPILFSGNYADLINKPAFATVATTGSYNSLVDRPILFSGSYNDLSNKPTLFSGEYADLKNKPVLATVATTGSYADLTNKPALFSGDYADLTNTPSIPSLTSELTNDSGFLTDIPDHEHAGLYYTHSETEALLAALHQVPAPLTPAQDGMVLTASAGTYSWQAVPPSSNFSGSYNDLTDKPALFSGDYADLTGTPLFADVAATGSYLDLTDTPTMFSGDYADLTGKPTIPTLTSQLTNDSSFVASTALAAVATSGSYNDLANKPSLFSGKYADLTGTPTFATVATSGSYSDLADKPVLFSGAYADLSGKPSIPSKTSEITNDSGFLTENQTITVTGDATGSGKNAISLTLGNSGVLPGNYKNTNITVDAKGRVTAASSGPAGPVIAKESTLVVSAATTINFTGPGVTVTDGGGGVANVAISGGGGGSGGGDGGSTQEVVYFQYTAGGSGAFAAGDCIISQTPGVVATIIDGTNCIVKFEFTGKTRPPSAIAVMGQSFTTNEFIYNNVMSARFPTTKFSGGGTAANPTFLTNFTDYTIQMRMADTGASAGLGQRAKAAIIFQF